MNLQRFGFYPFAVFIIKTLLRNLSNVDFWIEVRGKCLMVITRITIHNIQIMYLVEIMLGCVGGENTTHAWIETTTKDGRKPSLLELFFVCPLP